MATSYTTLLGLALPVQGELQGTWGDEVNNYITNYLDAAVAGTQNLSTDADATLTKTTGTGLGGTSSQYSILLFSGSRAAQRTVTVPAASKSYVVINATTGGFAVKVVGAGPTTGVTIANGEKAVIAWNGSDFVKVSTFGGDPTFGNVTVTGTTTLSGLTASTALALNASKEVVSVTNTGTGNNVLSASPTLTGTVGMAAATLSGNLTLSGGTANGVLYLDGSKVATSGSALVFDGTNFSTTGTATATKLVPTGNVTAGNGMYLPTTNELAWSVNGSEGMRLTSTGLGIGTSSPGTKLDVRGTINGSDGTNGNVRMYVDADYGFFQSLNPAANAYRPMQLMGSTISLANNGTINAVLDSSGNLGLGVTPSAWNITAMQVKNGSMYGAGSTETGIYSNAYYNSGWKYISGTVGSPLAAAGYTQNGSHQWYIAGTGTAGNAITFTQAMTLDASGLLALGRTNATNYGAGVVTFSTDGTAGAFHDFYYNGTRTGIIASASGQFVLDTTTDVPLVFKTVAAERARITSGGDFGIGTSSPAYKLDVVSTAMRIASGSTGVGYVQYGNSATASNNWHVGTEGDGTYRFYNGNFGSGTERARITSGGEFVIGDTTTLNVNAKLSVWNGSAGGSAFGIATGYGTTAGQFRLIYLNSTADALNFDNGNNNATLTSGGTWTNASDARLKKNIQTIKYGLNTVLAVQPRSFNRVDVDGEYIGFIAQELQTQVPEVVYGAEDTKYSVDYGSLVAVAFKAIQEQQALITDLRARVAALEAQ